MSSGCGGVLEIIVRITFALWKRSRICAPKALNCVWFGASVNQQLGFGIGVAPVEFVSVGGGGRQVRTNDGKSRLRGSKLKGEAEREGCATVLESC